MLDFFVGPGSVLVAFFLVAGYTIYTFIKSSHVERMAKIEKGLDTKRPSDGNRYLDLKLGVLMVGVAFGLLLPYFLEKILDIDAVFYPSSMLLFGGIGLIISFFWARKLRRNQ